MAWKILARSGRRF